ncbi:MAG TPA: OadG family protein [Candidatus Latescibacteria bacterium]|jgi:Na+-transporting methylmalonyl-CoA/oxaloacetate decarboxylase gamma subunit|nr:hypothetical protein [Gemmatimonadota bacterium]MDP7362864.1 OadG family protein [Candidatus Latescibacterota bacterium]HCV25877.1 hypothetical protein [Candidatus Latescibacterota bacterium]HJN28467.1 OadG family protein [Candidatus Latescibacterota bacterium]|tara:strand:- start:455 stop:721 length:267 start_codon:yes stop_codon:yes gene_type:complete
MPELDVGIQSIIDGQGVPIAIVGMSIVFVALTSIASFISVLPWLLAQLAKFVPETDHHAPSRPRGDDDSAAVAAAVAAFHAQRSGAGS